MFQRCFHQIHQLFDYPDWVTRFDDDLGTQLAENCDSQLFNSNELPISNFHGQRRPAEDQPL